MSSSSTELDLKNFAVLLDVDGTLLDIAPTPLAVHVPETLRRSLVAVGERSGGALALVSGRPIGELDRIFAPLSLPAVGCHGAEIRPSADGRTYEQRAKPLDRRIRHALEDVAGRFSGIVTEDKGYSYALHYRMTLDRGLEIVDAVFAACQPFPPDSYELLNGKAVLEVKSTGFNKGAAVRELMTYEPFVGRVPIFIGDDTTDEAAFAVMPEFKGLAISVGRKAPGVDGCFDKPEDVRRWLDHIGANAMVVPNFAELT